MIQKNNFKILIEYDGSQYAGWQIQPQKNTIQQQIQDAIFKITQESVKVIGSGRTDAGVHAREQVAHFQICNSLKSNEWVSALNHFLPKDIQIIGCQKVENTFHAQKSAISKTYRYQLFLGHHISVFKKAYWVAYPSEIDLNLLKRVCHLLVGFHDFSAFSANRGTLNEDQMDKRRNLMRFDFWQNDRELTFELQSNGFLYKMVRILIGMALSVAREKYSIELIKEQLQKPKMSKIAPAMPPEGLFLWKVEY